MTDYIKRNTWFIILLAIIVSFVVPVVGYWLKPYLSYFLMALMFLSCLDINVKEVLDSFHGFDRQIVVLLIVHLASPILVFFLKDYFSPEIFLGLILASTIPAGRSAVFLCNIYGGEPTKALVATSISNVISPIAVPAVVWFLAHTTININPVEMGSTILWLVIVPIAAAVIFRWLKMAKYLKNYSSSLSIMILFLIIIGIIAPIKDVVLNDLGQSVMLVVIVSVLIMIDFAFGYFVGKKNAEKITWAISSSYKNYTLATLVALSLFSPIVALPSIIYTIANNFLLIPLQLVFLRKN
jgi:predicted Na+-dependent transporter